MALLYLQMIHHLGPWLNFSFCTFPCGSYSYNCFWASSCKTKQSKNWRSEVSVRHWNKKRVRMIIIVKGLNEFQDIVDRLSVTRPRVYRLRPTPLNPAPSIIPILREKGLPPSFTSLQVQMELHCYIKGNHPDSAGACPYLLRPESLETNEVKG